MGGDPTKRFINRRTNAKSIPGVSSHRVYHRYVGFLYCFAIEAWPVKPAWETTDLSSRRRGNKRLFIGRRVSRLDRGRSIESLPFVSFNEPYPRLDIPREPDPEVMNFISRRVRIVDRENRCRRDEYRFFFFTVRKILRSFDLSRGWFVIIFRLDGINSWGAIGFDRSVMIRLAGFH